MTEPLTPADCDLRDFAYMPVDAARLLDSDFYALATAEEFRAAITLWCKAWSQVPAASLPNDERVLAHLSGAGAKWKKVRDMALRGFVLCSDGRLYHTVVAEKAKEAWAKRLSYRERSKKGNGARWGSQKDDSQQSQSVPSGNPSGITDGVLEPPKGRGRGSNTLAKASDAEASDQQFWTSASAYLGGKRSLIGKWCRDYGKPETAKAITAAQLERAVDPVAYIERVLRQRPAAKAPMVGV